MQPKNLTELLECSAEARECMAHLPQYAQAAAKEHADEIQTAEALRMFTQEFLRDDCYRCT